MKALNIYSIPSVQVRQEFSDLLDSILPKINAWIRQISRLKNIDEQFEYVCALTRDPLIARDVFVLAKQFSTRDPRSAFPLSLLYVYLTGKGLQRNDLTSTHKLAQVSALLDDQYEVGWNLWKAIKKGASSLYKGAKKAVKTIYKGGKKAITSVLKLTKNGVFWAIKKVFGKKIGGFITNAIELVTGTAAKMTFGMLKSTIKSLGYLIRGKWKESLYTLLQGINESILTPVLAPLAVALKLKPRVFKRVLSKAAKKNKMLALQIISLFFSGVSANVQQLVTQIITIMKPIILTLVKELSPKSAAKTIKAVDVGLTVILMIVQGVGSFNDIIDSIAAKLKIATARGRKELKANFLRAIAAIGKFNFKDFMRYLLRAVSAPGMDQMRQAVTAPSVTRLLSMKPTEVNQFMQLAVRDEKGSQAINQAIQHASPKVIKSVISTAVRKNPRLVSEVIKGSRTQGRILEAISQAA
jgi:hypothetical protein